MEQGPVCVSGATGYVASFIVRELLEKGYTVRATVRSIQNEEKLGPLRALNPDGERLRFVEMNMRNPETFPAALQGCSSLIHTATPIFYATDGGIPFATEEEAEEQQMRPAVEGTQALMSAAAAEGITTVVLTSSTAAMIATSTQPVVLDESCWSNEAYARSRMLLDPSGAYRLAKTLQERAAWDSSRTNGIRLVSINPSFVAGPSITTRTNITQNLFARLCRGEGFPYMSCKPGTVPDVYMPLVDVRDVAAAHVRALDPSVKGRYLLLTEYVHCADIVDVLRRFDDKFVSTADIRVDSVDGNRHSEPWKFDNSRAKNLGVCQIPWESTVRASGQSIIDLAVLEKV